MSVTRKRFLSTLFKPQVDKEIPFTLKKKKPSPREAKRSGGNQGVPPLYYILTDESYLWHRFFYQQEFLLVEMGKKATSRSYQQELEKWALKGEFLLVEKRDSSTSSKYTSYQQTTRRTSLLVEKEDLTSKPTCVFYQQLLLVR